MTGPHAAAGDEDEPPVTYGPVVELATAMIAAGLLLWLVIWAVRGWPSLPECFTTLTPRQRDTVDAFRAGALPLHAAAALIIAVALVRNNIDVHDRALGLRRPGLGTATGIAVITGLFVGAAFDPNVIGDTIGVLSFFAFVTAPAAVLLVVAGLVLIAWPARRWHARMLVQAGAWIALVLVIPAHYTAVWWIDEPFCMS